jgi:hypothetical protein
MEEALKVAVANVEQEYLARLAEEINVSSSNRQAHTLTLHTLT